tara:strand:- start:292 stop:774 length:483 start_codon:yes stop_codon:yes gene_type:complete
MQYIKIFIGILAVLSVSRFVPHPPNFTSLIALSFYIPAILGIRYLPALVISFVVTDVVIGLHSITFFTWGSVIIIGLISVYFTSSILSRLSGALLGALIFYLISNFGVWITGSYGYTIEGLTACYTLALPFFGYTLVSTIVFSTIIESVIYFYKTKIKIK